MALVDGGGGLHQGSAPGERLPSQPWPKETIAASSPPGSGRRARRAPPAWARNPSAPGARARRRRFARRCSRGSRRCRRVTPAGRPRSGAGRCSGRCSSGTRARSGPGARPDDCRGERCGQRRPPQGDPPRCAGSAATTRMHRSRWRRPPAPRPVPRLRCSRRGGGGGCPRRAGTPAAGSSDARRGGLRQPAPTGRPAQRSSRGGPSPGRAVPGGGRWWRPPEVG